MSDESASEACQPNERPAVEPSVSEWMRWNDIAMSAKRLPPPLEVSEAAARAA